MAGAKKLSTGRYEYRGYELDGTGCGWQIRESADDDFMLVADSKKGAMKYIDSVCDRKEADAAKEQYAGMTDAELIAIDGVGWAWLEA